MVRDGAGNSIIAWPDYRDGYWAVYIQKIDPSGNMLWVPGGVLLGRSACDEIPLTSTAKIALLCNEYGETVAAWYGVVNGATGPSAQMLDPSGNVLWNPGGILVCPGAMKNSMTAITSNGAGGALIGWTDTRNPDSDVFIQNVDRSGNILWASQGIAVCTAANDQQFVQMTSDLHGGAIVVWNDYRMGTWQCYAQRVNAFGVPLWAPNGVAACSDGASEMLSYYAIAPDGKGGVICSWRDSRSGFYDLYAQRIDSGGHLKWASSGIVVCSAYGTQAPPRAIDDGIGGAFITWHDYRSGDFDIYAQRVDSSGTTRWAYDGVPVCGVLGFQYYPIPGRDGYGGVVITWEDGRGADADMYAQRLDGDGNALWTVDGVQVCGAAGNQILPRMVCLANGDAVVGWMDGRAGTYDIYAQKMRSDGTMYSVMREPVILAVKDVPRDEGGFVRIKLRACPFDKAGETLHPITSYNVWRRMEEPFLLGARAGSGTCGALSGDDPVAFIATERKSEGIRLSSELASKLGFPPGTWESIGLHPATQDSIYYLDVATLKDSTGSDTAWEAYVVTAHTTAPSAYYVSVPESGYSVDNLGPGTPQGFSGNQSSAPPGLQLTWSANPERDLAHYALYRGSTMDFAPGPGNKLLETAATSAFDGEWTPANVCFYKLQAVDRHGNASVSALLMDGASIPALPLTLYQNIPNPFNPSTTIRYYLPGVSQVTLDIYDSNGRLVKRLVDREMKPSGNHEARWSGLGGDGDAVASGVYFYRLQTDTEALSKKMILLR